ncbi:MAG: preprotein translocase subunit SecG [Elusimicrobia bacterium CG08_land_8_20_14_0_20_51_18]|nr:MAG: preprotein translocase subunit SecG [Elusimicrobia bacterium CG08_land_8_20_14_0_20_51_18]
MYAFFMTLHLIVCLVLVVSILLFQSSKGSALAMFGGGGDSLFSTPSGTDFMKKFTAGVAVAFAVTSMLLTIMAPRTRYKSVVQDNPLLPPQQQEQQTPAQPAEKAPAAPVPAGK